MPVLFQAAVLRALNRFTVVIIPHMSIQKLTSLVLGLLVAGLFASDRQVVVSQKATVAVQGRVTTTGELPVGCAWVSLVRRDESGHADPDLLVSLGASAAVSRVQTDSNGRFSIELPSGLYDIRATVPGFEVFANDSPVTLGQDQEDGEVFLVSLVPLTSVAGTISGDEGDDVEGIFWRIPNLTPLSLQRSARLSGGDTWFRGWSRGAIASYFGWLDICL